MRWLNHEKTETWIIYFILVVVILIVLAVIGYMAGRWYIEPSQAQQARIDLYGNVPLDAVLLPIDRKALDEAYHAHLVRLWNVWLTDGAKDSSRFRNGLRITRGAYHEAIEALAKREQLLKEQGK
jgi:hypothetical protein